MNQYLSVTEQQTRIIRAVIRLFSAQGFSRRQRQKFPNAVLLLGLILCFIALPAVGQGAKSDQAGEPVALQIPNSSEPTGTNANANAPLTLTLHDALERARTYSPQFQAAVTAAKMAREDRLQARASMLPSAGFTSQYLGTQGNGVLPSGRFVTNDGVHVYRVWGVFREALSANTFTLAGYHRAAVAEALARAQQEIVQRGLTVVVTQAYYGLVVAERKYAT